MSDEMGGGTDEEKDENTGSECKSETHDRMMNRVKPLKLNRG